MRVGFNPKKKGTIKVRGWGRALHYVYIKLHTVQNTCIKREKGISILYPLEKDNMGGNAT